MSVSKYSLGIAAALAYACSVIVPAHAATTVAVVNPSFEAPNLGSASPDWSYLSGANAGWTFGSGAGVANLNSPWFYGSPPDGNQAAFIQGGTISQTLGGLTVGAFYDVTFWLARRPGGNSAGPFNPDPITVMLGGSSLGTYTPSSLAFTQVTTGSVMADSTSMVLSFVGQTYDGSCITCELDSAIDLVSVTDPPGSVPEPASGAVLLAGLAVVAVARRRTGIAGRFGRYRL